MICLFSTNDLQTSSSEDIGDQTDRKIRGATSWPFEDLRRETILNGGFVGVALVIMTRNGTSFKVHWLIELCTTLRASVLTARWLYTSVSNPEPAN